MTSDKAFLLDYFKIIAGLIDPKTGQPKDAECYRAREAMRARLKAIRAKLGKEQ